MKQLESQLALLASKDVPLHILLSSSTKDFMY